MRDPSSFAESIHNLSTHAADQKDHLKTEQAAIQSLVNPLLRCLGYNPSDGREVIPQAEATFKGAAHKVDYAIRKNENSAFIIECKKVGAPLDTYVGTLQAYFAAKVTSGDCIRIAILTDGLEYRFYADINKKNILDGEPFFTFNLLAPTDGSIKELERFTKSNFDADKIIKEVGDCIRNARDIAAIKQNLLNQLASPSVQFMGSIKPATMGHLGSTNQAVLRDLIPKAFEVLNAEWKSSDAPSDNGQVTPSKPSFTPDPREEEALDIVRGIAEGLVKADDLTLIRPTKVTFIRLDSKERTILRLQVRSKKSFSTPTIYTYPEQDKIDLNTLDDIRLHADQIRKRIQQVVNANTG